MKDLLLPKKLLQVNMTWFLLSLILLFPVLIPHVGSASGMAVQSVNIIGNPGFETPIPPQDPLSGPICSLQEWCADVYDDGNYGSSITRNSTLFHTGSYSARMDVSNNSTTIRRGVQTFLAQITLDQYLPGNTMFSNVTDRPDGLSVWFYIQPKYTGYTVFEIRLRSGNASEMDYIFANPAIGLAFANSTTGSEAGRPLKEFILPPPSMNQWIHLARNLRQDWLGPMKLPDGTAASGVFQANDTIHRLDINAGFFKNPANGSVFAEIGWVDDVAVFIDTTVSPPACSQEDNSQCDIQCADVEEAKTHSSGELGIASHVLNGNENCLASGLGYDSFSLHHH